MYYIQLHGITGRVVWDGIKGLWTNLLQILVFCFVIEKKTIS